MMALIMAIAAERVWFFPGPSPTRPKGRSATGMWHGIVVAPLTRAAVRSAEVFDHGSSEAQRNGMARAHGSVRECRSKD